MLEGYLKSRLGPNAKVYSAGTEPSGVDPQAMRVMAEDRVVIAGHTSDAISVFQEKRFTLVIVLDPNIRPEVEAACSFEKLREIEIPEVLGFGGRERMESVRQLRDQLKNIANDIAEEIKA